MSGFLLTNKAKADLIEIGHYTWKSWEGSNATFIFACWTAPDPLPNKKGLTMITRKPLLFTGDPYRTRIVLSGGYLRLLVTQDRARRVERRWRFTGSRLRSSGRAGRGDAQASFDADVRDWPAHLLPGRVFGFMKLELSLSPGILLR